jgi:hypothetical protein
MVAAAVRFSRQPQAGDASNPSDARLLPQALRPEMASALFSRLSPRISDTAAIALMPARTAALWARLLARRWLGHSAIFGDLLVRGSQLLFKVSASFASARFPALRTVITTSSTRETDSRPAAWRTLAP